MIYLKERGWHISSELSIGRAKSNSIVLPEPTTSRNECIISQHDGVYHLTPVSKKHLKLNGAQVLNPVVLKNKDVLVIAQHVFTFNIPPTKRKRDEKDDRPTKKNNGFVIDLEAEIIEVSSDDDESVKLVQPPKPVKEPPKPTKEQKTCDLCLEDLPFDEFQGFECNHEFCRQCICQYIKSRMDSKNLPIPCPKCQSEICANDLQLCMDEVDFDKYQKISMEILLENNPQQFSCCPTPDCYYAFFYVPGDATDFACPKCNKRYCLKCKVDMHIGSTCEKYQEWAKDNGKSDQLFEQFVTGSKFKKCPGCLRWVEKSTGCNHMTCKCKTQFCYLCGKLYPRECRGNCNQIGSNQGGQQHGLAFGGVITRGQRNSPQQRQDRQRRGFNQEFINVPQQFVQPQRTQGQTTSIWGGYPTGSVFGASSRPEPMESYFGPPQRSPQRQQPRFSSSMFQPETQMFVQQPVEHPVLDFFGRVSNFFNPFTPAPQPVQQEILQQHPPIQRPQQPEYTFQVPNSFISQPTPTKRFNLTKRSPKKK